jgi:hypothetical protein
VRRSSGGSVRRRTPVQATRSDDITLEISLDMDASGLDPRRLDEALADILLDLDPSGPEPAVATADR